jgi:hypothetical protein
MATKAKSIRLHLNTKDQKIQSLQDIISRVGGLAGCAACGRIAYLHIQTLGDPAPEFAHSGVISMQIDG